MYYETASISRPTVAIVINTTMAPGGPNICTAGDWIRMTDTLKAGQKVEEPEMREYIVSHLARHKVPKYIEFTDTFPMNAAGKVLKYKMREDAIKRLGLGKKE